MWCRDDPMLLLANKIWWQPWAALGSRKGLCAYVSGAVGIERYLCSECSLGSAAVPEFTCLDCLCCHCMAMCSMQQMQQRACEADDQSYLEYECLCSSALLQDSLWIDIKALLRITGLFGFFFPNCLLLFEHVWCILLDDFSNVFMQSHICVCI